MMIWGPVEPPKDCSCTRAQCTSNTPLRRGISSTEYVQAGKVGGISASPPEAGAAGWPAVHARAARDHRRRNELAGTCRRRPGNDDPEQGEQSEQHEVFSVHRTAA